MPVPATVVVGAKVVTGAEVVVAGAAVEVAGAVVDAGEVVVAVPIYRINKIWKIVITFKYEFNLDHCIQLYLANYILLFLSTVMI